MEVLEALTHRWRRAADKAVRLAVCGALLLGAVCGTAAPARAASTARLNINVTFNGITSVGDLTAVPGAGTGTISLTWTEPYHPGGTPPYSYDVRVSSMANITTQSDFNAAAPLSAVSPDVPPAPGAGGGAAGFVVTGLTQGVTYYFAIREGDSLTLRGSWVRSLSPPRNVNNFARATSVVPFAPAGGSLVEVDLSSVTATWATAANTTSYVLIASTAASLSPPAASSTTAASTGAVAGLAPNTTYFLGVAACGFGCSPYLAFGSTMTLAAPAVSLSTTALSSSTVSLAWNPNGNPAGTTYQVRRSTDGVSYAQAAVSNSAGASVFGLSGGGTYYFQVVAVNGGGVAAAPSNVVSVVTPAGPVPSTPSGLAAAPGVLAISVTWDALPAAQQGSGLLYYALQRSTNSAFGYVTLATTTGASYLDRPLAAGATYFYRLIARDVAQVDGAPTTPVSAAAYTLRPMEPLGLKVTPSSSTVAISWTPTSRFFDGSAFASTGAPTADELAGYSLYRTTDVCRSPFVWVSSLTISATTLTDVNNGLNYYYRLFSFNSAGVSTDAVTVSALGEQDYFVDDCITRVTLDDQTAASLTGAVNGVGDIRLVRARRPQDVGNGVYQSVEWQPYLNGTTLLKGWTLPKPARVVLHFETSNGAPVPDTAPASGFTPFAAAPAAGGVGDLGVYWFNGVQYQKMYGKVDPVGQVVTVESVNPGLYQVRAQARAAGAVFDVSNLSGRVITPNGDGRNDVVIFTYDPGPRGVTPEGKIFDVKGAFVTDMTSGPNPDTLMWNGTVSGTPVHSGVYVYRITGDGKTFTGTIVVAR